MTRYDIINALIDARGYNSFLEIGTYRGETFNHVHCPIKRCVDPDPMAHATFQMTSDAFFTQNRKLWGDRYDIIFIDGLHEREQVWRDIGGALWCLHDNGAIVMHDCLPTSEEMQEWHDISQQGKTWTGDVWKAYLKALHSLPFLVYVVDTDYGCGIIDTTRPSHMPHKDIDMDLLEWKDFDKAKMNARDALILP